MRQTGKEAMRQGGNEAKRQRGKEARRQGGKEARRQRGKEFLALLFIVHCSLFIVHCSLLFFSTRVRRKKSLIAVLAHGSKKSGCLYTTALRNNILLIFYPVTNVPTCMPSTTFKRLPGLFISNTMMGILFSIQRVNAVISITLRLRVKHS